MATTALIPGGYSGRPYGSFAGKEASADAGAHNPGRITTLWPYGGAGHLYGSFAGKEPSAGATPTVAKQPVWPKNLTMHSLSGRRSALNERKS